MTIYDVIRHEHYVIRAYLTRIQELDERRPATRQRLLIQLQTLLVAHAAAIEVTFHEPLHAFAALAPLVRRARIRHDVAASLLEVMTGLAPDDADWTSYFAILSEVLEQQMRREEKDVCRAARKVLDKETAEAMGEAMLEMGKGSEAMAKAEIPPLPLSGEGSRSLH